MKVRPLNIGLAAAGLALVSFLIYTQHYERETSGGEGIPVLVAVRRIERGTVISDALLTTKSIPQAYVDDRQVRASERDTILGLKAAEPVGVSQALLWSDVLTTRDEKRDLSSLVQAGYRAITAPFAAMPTYAMIRPGDFVDVIAARADADADGLDSTLLLQRVMVLAIGNSTAEKSADDARGGPSRSQPVLTLSLNLRDAELLAAVAAAKGKLTVALRNPNDQRVRDDVGGEEALDLLAPRPATRKAAADEFRGGAAAPESLPLELKAERRARR
jgi:pilus assembly protein CpaB